VAMRWIKPVQRRAPGQKTAHLILSLTDVTTANRAIANGLLICNRRTRIEKIKKEPTRCLKCHGWNHYANKCVSLTDVCGNCAERHRTSQCTQPQLTCCVSCDMDSHASWSRECPTFLRKVDECNHRNPENALQFIPSAEPWTWTAYQEEHRDWPKVDTCQQDRNPHSNPHNPPPGTHEHSRNEPNQPQNWTWRTHQPGDWSQDAQDWNHPPQSPQLQPAQAAPTAHTSSNA